MSKRNVLLLSILLLCISLTMSMATAHSKKDFSVNSTSTLTGTLSITGVTASRIDTNGNGLYNILNLTVHISAINIDYFTLYYSFYGLNSTNQTLFISKGSDFPGSQMNNLLFSGKSIVDSAPNCSRFELQLYTYGIGSGNNAFTDHYNYTTQSFNQTSWDSIVYVSSSPPPSTTSTPIIAPSLPGAEPITSSTTSTNLITNVANNTSSITSIIIILLVIAIIGGFIAFMGYQSRKIDLADRNKYRQSVSAISHPTNPGASMTSQRRTYGQQVINHLRWCPKCGSRFELEDKYCQNCGSKLF